MIRNTITPLQYLGRYLYKVFTKHLIKIIIQITSSYTHNNNQYTYIYTPPRANLSLWRSNPSIDFDFRSRHPIRWPYRRLHELGREHLLQITLKQRQYVRRHVHPLPHHHPARIHPIPIPIRQKFRWRKRLRRTRIPRTRNRRRLLAYWSDPRRSSVILQILRRLATFQWNLGNYRENEYITFFGKGNPHTSTEFFHEIARTKPTDIPSAEAPEEPYTGAQGIQTGRYQLLKGFRFAVQQHSDQRTPSLR